MAYLITEFDGIALPEYEPEQDDSAAAVQSALIDSIGGAADYYGATTRLPRKYSIEVTGIYLGETTYLVDETDNYIVDEDGNYIIAGDAINILRAQVQALRAKVGRRGQLVRIRQDDDVEQWITARLLQVRHDKRQNEMARLAKMTCLFESVHTAWRAATATQKSVSASAGVAAGLTVSNGGDVTVYDATLTVARTSGTITGVTVTGPGVAWTWAGSLASGALVIDCAAQTVRAAGVDAYSGFALSAGHTVRGWLPLEPGDNVFLVTVTGGAATVTVTHYNQFR